MTKLSREDVLKLAKLAKLQLTEEEVERYQKEIDSILGYVEQLNSLDLDGVEPTSQVTGLTNVMRPDEIVDYGPSQQDLLKNAPSIEENHLKVRRVL